MPDQCAANPLALDAQEAVILSAVPPNATSHEEVQFYVVKVSTRADCGLWVWPACCMLRARFLWQHVSAPASRRRSRAVTGS